MNTLVRLYDWLFPPRNERGVSPEIQRRFDRDDELRKAYDKWVEIHGTPPTVRQLWAVSPYDYPKGK